MMSDFRQLSAAVWASPQLSVKDVAEASAEGFGLVINNRPDGEAEDQPTGDAIAAAASAAGMGYCAIPIGPGGFGEEQISAMIEALEGASGKTLAYCRSGTRSTFLWSLARARLGDDLEAITAAASGAGYDIGPICPAMEMMAANSRE